MNNANLDVTRAVLSAQMTPKSQKPAESAPKQREASSSSSQTIGSISSVSVQPMRDKQRRFTCVNFTSSAVKNKDDDYQQVLKR